MLELPEVLTLAEQLNDKVVGKKVIKVLPPTKEHKFCWFSGEPTAYDGLIKGSEVIAAEGFGIFAEITFDNGYKLCLNDGINVRLIPYVDMPKDYQLLIELSDEIKLVFTVAMYGGIVLHDGYNDNEYYIKSRQAVSPFTPEFEAYYRQVFANSKPKLSAKAFLAAEQRFPGIGNGSLQDILFAAGIHPKRKIVTLGDAEKDALLRSAITVLQDITKAGGRDTEKNLFGQKGGYPVKMCKNTVGEDCPKCGSQIVKETYMGGSVYYCPVCQPLVEV